MSLHTYRALLVSASCLAISSAQAQAQTQALTDPTRPPSASAGPAGGLEDVPAGKQLQSVLISDGRKVAIIDGASVRLGGMVGEARLVRISETEVVLKNGEETEVLKLYPSVEKKPVKRATRRQSRQGGTK